MSMYAQVTNQGTAMSETALCGRHHADPSIRAVMATTRDAENGEMLSDTARHDCSNNDALECQHCGYTETRS